MITLKDVFIGDFRMSQAFGLNPQMYAQFGMKGHNGIDWACPNGTQLVCCFDEAEVVRAEDDKTGYGLHLRIWDKKQGVVAIYGHCRELKVKLGDIVKFGQLIALSDNTGYSTGAHFHFGVAKVNNKCERINIDNGYSGWLNPFDGRIFEWKVENLKVPIEEEDMTDEEQRILQFVKEQGATEGDVRAGVGYVKDKTVERLETDVKSLKTQVSDLIKRTSEQDLQIKDITSKLDGEIKNGELWQTELKTASKKVDSLTKQVETKEQELTTSKEVANKYQRLYKEALAKNKDKSIFIKIWLLIKKLFK